MTKAYTNITNALGAAEAEKKVTPQTKPIPGREKEMVKNAAGGFVFKVDAFTQLDRFLILGTEGGTYYASEQKHTANNATNVLKAITADGVRVVNRVVEISQAGRAPKNDPALLVLALAMVHGDMATKEAAIEALPQVARIGTHVLHFADFIDGMKGFNGKNSVARRAMQKWYTEKTAFKLAEQLTKYAQRDGWSHGDVLRLTHPKAPSTEHDALFAYAVGKDKPFGEVQVYMTDMAALKACTNAKEAAALITKHKFPREVVPTQLLNDVVVWEALMPHMGITALVRNLATLTRIGYIAPMNAGLKEVVAKLSDVEMIAKSRIHPIQALSALLTYKSGHSTGGSNTWTPVAQIVDALDALFYYSFGAVTPTGKRIGYFIDVSGSMAWESSLIAAVSGLYARDAAAALAMVSARVEKDFLVAAFSSGNSRSYGAGIQQVSISPRQRLDDVMTAINSLPMGGTDCSLPMLWAKENKIDLDAFVVLTDHETYAGTMAPSQALTQYRRARGIPAKMIVAGLTSTGFSIADSNDSGMMDCVGFDTAAPELMSSFIRGDF